MYASLDGIDIYILRLNKRLTTDRLQLPYVLEHFADQGVYSFKKSVFSVATAYSLLQQPVICCNSSLDNICTSFDGIDALVVRTTRASLLWHPIQNCCGIPYEIVVAPHTKSPVSVEDTGVATDVTDFLLQQEIQTF